MKRFRDQRYEKLVKHHRSLGVPWTDPTFPANDSSIGLEKARELRGIEWRRIGEICTRPRLVKNGVGRHDVIQGKLGNCWFVAAASVLAGVEPLWEKVVPDVADQEWDEENRDKYSGVFKFRFWRGVGANWTEILVDDYIPTRDGIPVFTYSKDPEEFWGALLEKAYAKLNGSYSALDGGNLADALVDFTGGVAEMIQLKDEAGSPLFKEEDEKLDLFSRVAKEVEEHALVCCAIRTMGGMREERTETGLVKGHAYGVTAVKRVPIGSTGLSAFFKGREKIPLVRLRNPWGEKEWNGAFSDRSPEWNSVSTKDRDRLGLVTADDGEFWMSWEDFVEQFTDLSINHLINTSVFSFSKTWKEVIMVGKWQKPGEAGGCLNHKESFLRNPQYRFDVNCKEGEEEEVIFQLSQDDDCTTVLDKQKLVIGVNVMRVEANRMYQLHRIPTGSESVLSSDYIRSRHIFFRAKLRPGRYVIIPTTFQPREEGSFLLRVFGEKMTSLIHLDLEEPKDPPCLCCGCAARPKVATKVTVISASGLPVRTMGKADPYLVVRCEGEVVRSPALTNSTDPVWNFSAIFFRKKPETKPIKIQVWDSNLVVDTFLGQHLTTDKETTDNPRSEQNVELYNKGSKKEEKMQGSLRIIVETQRNLAAF